jgi:hypothetical protein
MKLFAWLRIGLDRSPLSVKINSQMIPLFLAAVFSFNALEVGVGVGTNTPIGNMERYFSASAAFSVYLGKEIGRERFILSYENSALGGNGLPSYQLQLNEISIEYGHSVIKKGNWSLPISLGIYNIWLSREWQNLKENGTVQGIDLGAGFLETVQRAKFGLKFTMGGLYSFSEPKNSAYLLKLKVLFGYEI